MRHLEICPSPWLRPHVQLIWCLELEHPDEFGPPERIAPDGIVELVFHYRRPMAIRFAGEPFTLQPASSVVSQTRRFVEICPRGPTGLISVRFHPWGAVRFLGRPVSEIADRMLAAEDVWGTSVRELEECLAAAGDVRSRVALIESFLLDRLDVRAGVDAEAMVRRIRQGRGACRVAEICRDFGFSERKMQRISQSALGMAPRSYARLTRFLRACSMLRRGQWCRLTDVAHECGYYDQAHFNGDFKALSGLTPMELVASPHLSFLELD